MQVSVFENEKVLASWTTYLQSGSFNVDDGESLDARIQRAIFRQDEITLALSEPQFAVSVDLTFRSASPNISPPAEQSFPPAENPAELNTIGFPPAPCASSTAKSAAADAAFP